MRRSERFASLKEEFITAEKQHNEMVERNFQEKLSIEINRYKKAVEEDIKQYKNSELFQYKNQLKQKQSQVIYENKKELTNYRNQLCEDLFMEVKKELVKFMSSDKYSSWLNDKCIQICSDDSFLDATIKCNQVVSEYLAKTIKKYNLKLVIDEKIDSGFIVVKKDNTVEVNVQLFEILKQQETWFYHNSNLVL